MTSTPSLRERATRLASEGWQRLKTDRLLQARILLWIAMVSHAVVLVILARGWFFTGDDWDYLTRDGFGNILESHNGHITGITAGFAVMARSIGGLDYWPVYPIIISLTWPLVAFAGWSTWRRSGVEPIPAAIGGILLAWLVTGAFIQFGHISVAFVLASLILVVPNDEKALTPRRGLASIALSLVAVIAGSFGVVATAVRWVISLGYRKWTGVVGASGGLAAYALIRMLVGTDKDLDFAFGIGDVVDIIRIIIHLVAVGMRWVFFVPPWLASASVVVLMVVAALVLVWARFSYRTMVWILSGSAFLFTVAVVRFLNSPVKTADLLAGEHLAYFLSVRYLNVPLVLLIITVLPLLVMWSKKGRSALRQSLLVGAVLLLVGGGVVQTVDMFGRISNKSIVKAEEAASIVPLVAAGEPIVSPERLAGTTNGQSFRFLALEELSADGLASSILESDIYRVRDTSGIDEEWGRGELRFTTSIMGRSGSWSQVGLPDLEGCIHVNRQVALEMRITESVRFELVRSEEAKALPVDVFWTDEFGVGRLRIKPTEPLEKGLFVVTAAPREGSPPATVTVWARNIEVCFEG